MQFDNLPEHLKEKWFVAARDEYSKQSLSDMHDYKVEALVWYWGLMLDGFDHEPPQSYEEALLWHQYQHNSAQARLELARRAADRAERWLHEWEQKRRSVATS